MHKRPKTAEINIKLISGISVLLPASRIPAIAESIEPRPIIIDPPKPEDEDQLLPAEILLINKCDENFDKWNDKYFRVATWTWRIVVFWSHKFFMMPFTHFFGYLQFTLRS